MTTIYEGSDLDECLAHFFKMPQVKDIVKKVLSDHFVFDFESLNHIYEDPTEFYVALQNENPKAFNVARGGFAKAAGLTKAWENEAFVRRSFTNTTAKSHVINEQFWVGSFFSRALLVSVQFITYYL